MDGNVKQYHYALDIQLLSRRGLNIIIVVDREVGAPGHGKYVVGGLNNRYKLMLRLEMEKLLNLELI